MQIIANNLNYNKIDEVILFDYLIVILSYPVIGAIIWQCQSYLVNITCCICEQIISQVKILLVCSEMINLGEIFLRIVDSS